MNYVRQVLDLTDD